MIGLPFVYTIAGCLFGSYGALSLLQKRYANGGFWGLLALSFLAGDRLGDIGNGLLVLCLVTIAGLRRMRAPAVDTAAQPKPVRSDTLFLPMLVVPATALFGTLAFKRWPALVDPKQATLVALALGVILALTVSTLWLKPGLTTPFRQGLRLMDAVGWAAILPQTLASLGAIFAKAGMGVVVGQLIGQLIPHGSRGGAVLAFGLGMALFTVVMGNAFAAFPVMMAAVGLPLLVHTHHGDPAVICAIGMLSGFCGTLLTPMAANFNIVPAILLALEDRHAVIRAQAPTGLLLLAVNMTLIYCLAF